MPGSLLSDGWVAFLLGGLVLLAAVIGLRPRRRPAPEASGPRGVGAALAFALDGDLTRARALMEARVRSTRGTDPDAVLGLLAILRAEGNHARAAALVVALLRRRPAAWLFAAGVRICLDAGQPARAAALARKASEDPRRPVGRKGDLDGHPPRGGPLPLDLQVAAFVRAGRPDEALSVLAGRVGRKESTPAQLGSVQAILALQLARTGDERGARRRLKRAVALAPEALAVLVAASKLHGRPAERARAAARLAERVGVGGHEGHPVAQGSAPARSPRPGRTPSAEVGIDEGGALGLARAAFLDGKVEEALGRLRDRLDAAPDDERVRRQYEAWLLAHGQPADWRAALAERAERGVGRLSEEAVLACDHCGFVAQEPVFLCPRCDRFDTLHRAPAVAPRPGVRPSAAGARLVDLAPEDAGNG